MPLSPHAGGDGSAKPGDSVPGGASKGRGRPVVERPCALENEPRERSEGTGLAATVEGDSGPVDAVPGEVDTESPRISARAKAVAAAELCGEEAARPAASSMRACMRSKNLFFASRISGLSRIWSTDGRSMGAGRSICGHRHAGEGGAWALKTGSFLLGPSTLTPQIIARVHHRPPAYQRDQVPHGGAHALGWQRPPFAPRDLHHDRGEAAPVKRALQHDELVEDAASAPHIRLVIVRLAVDDLVLRRKGE